MAKKLLFDRTPAARPRRRARCCTDNFIPLAPTTGGPPVANPTADVTVGVAGGTADTAGRHGEYYHDALTVGNNVYPEIEIKSLYGATATQSGHVFNPPATELFTHDADGNLTQDGRWDYVWDGENRLMKMRSRSGSRAPERRIEFEYDWQGRRIRKTVFDDRDDGQGGELSDTVFLYDGWNLIAELDANAGNQPIRTYVWGNDLSGTLQSTGGVGGLLKIVNHGDSSQHSVAYDGNGNVMGLVKDSDGSVSVPYEYGPFGEPLRASGEQAANPFRFSTKYCDAESGLYYYGRRVYDPPKGRWLSRDPAGETASVALLAFVHNVPLQRVDFLVLCECGADVTRPTMATLKSIERHWDNDPAILRPGAKKAICGNLLTPPGAFHAWDIVELGYTTGRIPACKFFERGSASPEDCPYSAQFKGHCYNAGQMNFALCGLLFRLCRALEDVGEMRGLFNEWFMENLIRGWKALDPPKPIYVEQAIGFARYGFNNYTGLSAPPFTECKVRNKRTKRHKFRWVLEPVAPRGPVEPPCVK